MAAVKMLERVLAGRSLGDVLADGLRDVPAGPEQSLARELVYGVLRWYSRLTTVRDNLLAKPLKARDRDIELLIVVGLYQCMELRTPPHAAVAATAEVARRLGKVWAVGLVNAILRRFLREREQHLAVADVRPATRYAHPDWLIGRYRAAWPDDWERLLAENNARPPMTLRINRRRTSPEQYLSLLAEQGLAALPHPHAVDALVLDTPVPVERLPGFQDGLLSVQDAAAQLAADLLDVPDGGRVLDACAAPGGKTCHVLERYPAAGEVVALDVSTERLQRVEENLRRLDLHATVKAGDAAQPEAWWDGVGFDRILIDAPCSGSGVIRRNPDIKWLRRDEDLAVLAQQQGQILSALWPLLKPGGQLVYATCSVLPEENEQVLADFLAARTDALPQPLDEGWGVGQPVGRYILTGESGMDGFYYGCLRKS
jgi:16S rRNA (cytosine967-C5)-methyltransferase